MKNVLKLCLLIMLLPKVFLAADLYQWKNVIIGGGGFVSGIVTCPTQQNLIFAKTDVGGAYRWVEETQSWKALNDWVSTTEKGYLGIESIAIDPQNPNRVYMSAGLEYFSTPAAILSSDDYGDTFRKTVVPFMIHGNGYGRGNGERLMVDPNDSTILFCGSRKHGLWKSSDMAKSWQKVSTFPVSVTPNGNGICAIAFDPASGSPGAPTQRIFVAASSATAANIYVSEDGGSTWNPVAGTPADKMPQRMVITPAGMMYVTFANGAAPHGNQTEALNKGSLLKYNIGTQTWTDITPNKTSAPAMSGISFSQTNPDILMASTTNTWWGQNWSASGTVWGDEIYKSTNGGASWTALFSSKKVTLDRGEFTWADAKVKGTGPLSLHWAACIEIDPFNADRAFVTSGNGLFMTANLSAATTIWKFQVKGLEETVPLDLISPPYGAPFISVIGDYDGFRHDNLDRSPLLGRHNPSIGTTVTLDFAEKNPKVVARAGSSAYYSADNAKTWKPLPLPVTGAKNGSIAVSANGSTIVWSPDGLGAYTTSDMLTWTKATGVPNGQRIVADRVNSQKFYVVANQQLLISNDGGKTFTAAATGTALTQVRKFRAAPGYEGELWIPNGTMGLYRTIKNNEVTEIKKVAGVSRCEAVGFGKAATGKNYPALYIWGTLGTVEGVFRSDDEGATWVRINDDAHEFGGTGNANEVIGDPRVYGRVYMSTAGRGTVYGDLIDGPDAGYIYDTEFIPTNVPLLEKNKEKLFNLQYDKNNSAIYLLPREKGYYEIYSVTGQIMDKRRCVSQTRIDNELPGAVYVIRFISDSGKIYSEKFILKR
ncbi:MAG TPA: hypothetical protein VFG54_11430 [Prolixibacteraceae bacterium]|nr:hypothetical protein [Prolixibacteraceae bacterium]